MEKETQILDRALELLEAQGPGGLTTRAVCEAAGIKDILTKSLGSSNMLNIVQATFDALSQLFHSSLALSPPLVRLASAGTNCSGWSQPSP